MTAALCPGAPRTPSRALAGLSEPPRGLRSGGQPSSLETLGHVFPKSVSYVISGTRLGLCELHLPPSGVWPRQGLCQAEAHPFSHSAVHPQPLSRLTQAVGPLLR